MASAVYTGAWVNWTKGVVAGSTLTVSSQTGAFLIAFTALFVSIAGGHLWTTFCYLVFQWRSVNEPPDGLYHQQQAILRNASSDSTALWDLLKVSWHWRRSAKRPFLRSIGLVLAALASSVGFIIAGIFSSSITSANSEVLLRGDICGVWLDAYLSGADYSTDISTQERTDYLVNLRSNLLKSSAFAAACYNQSSTSSAIEACLPYGRRQIGWTSRTNVSCPFAPEMCRNNTVVEFDTGRINSHTDLGINAPKNDRVEYQRVMRCAPLSTDGFSRGWANYSSLGRSGSVYAFGYPEESFLNFYYGSEDGFGIPATFAYSNYTFAWSVGNSEWNVFFLDTEVSLLTDSDSNLYKSTFQAIPQLQRSDADVSLLFLAQNVSYTGPIEDPWFYATTPIALIGGQTQTFYSTAPDSPVSVVGCTEQHQLCNPATSQCTGLSGLTGVLHHKWESLGLTERQIATYNRSFAVASDSILSATTQILGAKHMLVQNHVGYGNAATLPPDQWIRELSNWFGTMMANLQLRSLQYAAGPSSPRFFRYVRPPRTRDEKAMCTRQIIRRTDFASFDVLGLALIFILGGLIILVNLTLSSVVDRLQQATPQGQHRIREWDVNGTLKLQRIAFQKHGTGLETGRADLAAVAAAAVAATATATEFEHPFANRLPSVAGDAAVAPAGPAAVKPTRSALSRLWRQKGDQMPFTEIKDLDTEPPASVTQTGPDSADGAAAYAEHDPWKGRLFDNYGDAKTIG